MNQTDRLIDRFVEKVNSSPREPLPPWDVSPDLRVGVPEQYGYCDWRIRRSDAVDWIAPFEGKLPARLPPAFCSLVTRYVYPELEVGDLCLLANTGEDTMHEWRSVVGVDDAKDYLTRVLIANGYVQFGRPYESVNHDAFCFDTRRISGLGEFPIVWIDHEAILCHDRIRLVQEITPSFAGIIEDYVAGGPGLKL